VKAIIVVHLYGMPAKMDRIMEIADRYEIPVVEDAAEALGSRYNGKQAGTFGKMGVLSFNGNKIITTSGGGALISDEKELIDRARFLATQARDRAPHYQHSQIGYNYRMSNILAGIGRGQMEVIDQRVQSRREIFGKYRKTIESFPGLSMQEEPSPDYFSNRWLSTILMDEKITGLTWHDLQRKFENYNIETRPLWKPMHLQPVFADSPAYINGASDRLFACGLCLPSGSNMKNEDTDRVIDILERIIH
jgi:dTDP-4-amino-4,6-dideoxygalactose transaminase